MRRFWNALCVAILALATILLVLRFTVRDAWPLAAWIHYFFGLPPIVAALFAVGAVGSLLGGRRARFAVAMTAAVVVALGWWLPAYHRHSCQVEPEAVRVVSWNVSRLRRGREQVLADLRRLDADLMLLVEAGHDNRAARSFWNTHFPDHALALPGGGIALLARGSLGPVEFGEMDGISHYARSTVTIGGRALRVMVVDLDASPRFDKQRLVPEVFRLATQSGEGPLLVAGDFNTPIVSSVFAPVRRRFRHAFETAGNGLLATWPARLPLTAIDHVWGDPGVHFQCTTLLASPGSDHRAVVADIAF